MRLAASGRADLPLLGGCCDGCHRGWRQPAV